MSSSNIDSLTTFQLPSLELEQQKELCNVAQKYYNFFGFTDGCLIFLRYYLKENFEFLKYFGESTTLMNQGCHKFLQAWSQLQKDPSPLIKGIFCQIENIISLSSSFSPIEFKVEEEIREDFSKKINSLKGLQKTIDSKFQTAWRQCLLQTSIYYQKFEEYKQQNQKLRSTYERYENQTRDQKAYNITWLEKLDAKMSLKVDKFKKEKEEFEKVSWETQENYKAILTFFEEKKETIEEFIQLFLSILIEMTMFIIERAQENFVYLKQATSEILLKLKGLNLQCDFEQENLFIKTLLDKNVSSYAHLKEMSRVNHLRHEFLIGFGSLSQDTMQLCQDFIEKFIFFEEKNTISSLFSQIKEKTSEIIMPFEEFLEDIKNIFIRFFNLEKFESEHIIQEIASQRSKAYSQLTSSVSKVLYNPNSTQEDSASPQENKMKVIQEEVTLFLDRETSFAKAFVKDMERLYENMNQGIWMRIIQICQKRLSGLQEQVTEEKLKTEVQKIKSSIIGKQTVSLLLPQDETDLKAIELIRRGSSMTPVGIGIPEEFQTVADENNESQLHFIDKYNKGEFKFFKEKKAEVLAKLLKKENEKKLQAISATPSYKIEDSQKGRFRCVSSDEGERILESFACAFVDKILLQGRMYITTKKIVFKSHFNGQTLFGSTIICLPLEDIVFVQKKKNTFGLENMIEIITKKGVLEFTSYVFRDQAFDIIEQTLKAVHPSYAREYRNKRSMSSSLGDILDLDALEEVEQNGNKKVEAKIKKTKQREREFQRRNKAILAQMPPLEKFEQLAFKLDYDIDYNTFVQVILGSESLTFKEKNYSCFWNLYETQTGSYNIQVNDWNKEMPSNVTSKKALLSHLTPLERACKGTRDLAVSLPGVPKKITYDQKQTAYFVNEALAALHLDVTLVEKIPYGDAFKARTCFIIRDTGKKDDQKGVSIECKYYFEWFYSTIMKKMLIKGATDEIMAAKPIFEKLIAELKQEGIFDQKYAELQVLNQEEDQLSSNEMILDQENEDDIDIESKNDVENQGRQDQIQNLQEAALENAIPKFRVSKRVLFVYFSMVLLLVNYLFIKVIKIIPE